MPFYLLFALVPALLSQVARSESCSSVPGIKLTYYGYADGNSDMTALTCEPGIAHNQGGKAGGTGTHDDPMTFATSAGSTNFEECEIIYVPYTKKYYIYMDHCSGCDNSHIDLWVGTSNSGGQAQIDCEISLGSQSGQTIIKNPPDSLEVTKENLWDGSCHKVEGTNVFPDADTSSSCSGGSSSSSSSGSDESSASSAGGESPSTAVESSDSSPTSASQADVTPAESQPEITTAASLPEASTVDSQPVASDPAVTEEIATPSTTFATVTVSSILDRESSSSSVELKHESPNRCHRPGHCVGDPCEIDDDCARPLTCVAEKCHKPRHD